MNESAYRLITRFIKLCFWRGRFIGRENLPSSGPAVFVSNHLNELGPIACVSEIPLRLYPWIHWKMLAERETLEFLRIDFVEKSLRLRPPLSLAVAGGLSRIVLPLMRSLGCIPVHRGEGFSAKQVTWEASLARLRAGDCLLVFPEDPESPADPATGIHRFMHGVLWLADVYYHATSQPLPYYLIAVHPSRKMMVRPRLLLSPQQFTAKQSKTYWSDLFEQTIIEMYRELEQEEKYPAPWSRPT